MFVPPPQWPLVFSMYMLPPGSIIHKHTRTHKQYHCCANDTDIYVLLKTNVEANLHHLICCPSEIKCWMFQNVLILNENKSDITVFGPLPLCRRVLVPCLQISNPQTWVWSLIVTSCLTNKSQEWSNYVSCTWGASQKSGISSLVLILRTSYISPRLDYCKGMQQDELI